MNNKIKILSTREFNSEIELVDLGKEKINLKIILPYFFMLNIFIFSTFLGIVI